MNEWKEGELPSPKIACVCAWVRNEIFHTFLSFFFQHELLSWLHSFKLQTAPAQYAIALFLENFIWHFWSINNNHISKRAQLHMHHELVIYLFQFSFAHFDAVSLSWHRTTASVSNASQSKMGKIAQIKWPNNRLRGVQESYNPTATSDQHHRVVFVCDREACTCTMALSSMRTHCISCNKFTYWLVLHALHHWHKWMYTINFIIYSKYNKINST